MSSAVIIGLAISTGFAVTAVAKVLFFVSPTVSSEVPFQDSTNLPITASLANMTLGYIRNPNGTHGPHQSYETDKQIRPRLWSDSSILLSRPTHPPPSPLPPNFSIIHLFLNKSVPLLSDAILPNMSKRDTPSDPEISPTDLVTAFTLTDIITISLGLLTLVATVAGSYLGYKSNKNVQRKR